LYDRDLKLDHLTIECHRSGWIGQGLHFAQTWTNLWLYTTSRNAAGRKLVQRMIGIFIGNHKLRHKIYIYYLEIYYNI